MHAICTLSVSVYNRMIRRRKMFFARDADENGATRAASGQGAACSWLVIREARAARGHLGGGRLDDDLCNLLLPQLLDAPAYDLARIDARLGHVDRLDSNRTPTTTAALEDGEVGQPRR
jgi:hypothetical protein